MDGVRSQNLQIIFLPCPYTRVNSEEDSFHISDPPAFSLSTPQSMTRISNGVIYGDNIPPPSIFLPPFRALSLSLAWFDMPHAPSQTDGRRAGCNTNNTILSDCGGGGGEGSDDSLRSGERRERERERGKVGRSAGRRAYAGNKMKKGQQWGSSAWKGRRGRGDLEGSREGAEGGERYGWK